MNQVLITSITPEELFAEIRKIVQEEISKKEAEVKYITRNEAAELLKISLVTVDRYIKLKLIPIHRMGNRILIDPKELNNSLYKKHGTDL